MRRLLIAVVAVGAIVVAAVALLEQSTAPPPARVVQSFFQDDQLLLYQAATPAGAAEVQRTLVTLKALGVDRLRLTIEWGYIAPDPTSTTEPRGFNASDPAAYAASSWAIYDRIDVLAHADGIGVDFDVTAPGPLWAMQPKAPDAKTALHYLPSAAQFGQFVEAVGRRYDGHYRLSSRPLAGASRPLPRVSFWSIWNEPNQPGWLAPQWTSAAEPSSPSQYRQLVDAAYSALETTGHGRDTILIGELAPEGTEQSAAEDPMTPMVFLRALYCVGPGYQPLQGKSATALGCPRASAGFAKANPALFQATGFAHHPYSFFAAPGVSLSDPNFVPLADLGRLEQGLDRAFAAYGVSRKIPIYLTEYGYQTAPPRTKPPETSLRDQAMYIDEAEYLAWRDGRVRGLSQFLLQDSAPDPDFPVDSQGYWSTFQTGLELLGGAPKPALNAYRFPIYLPQTRTQAGGSLLVWGMLRMAPNRTRQTAEIQWRPSHGAYRTIASVSTDDPSGFLTDRVIPPGTGSIRLRWASASGQTFSSRGVGISVTG